MTNGINVTNTYCGCGGSKVIVANGQSEENPIFKKVDELPTVGDATRNHAYILPDNTVWVVNADGTDFSQLNGGSGAGGAYDDTELRGLIQQALDRNTMEDNRLVNIENKNATQDERLTALENNSSSGEAYDDTEIKERIQALEFRPDLDTVYTAGTGISISTDNVISATGGGNSYDDTELRGQVSAMSTLLDSKLTLSADNMSPTEAGLGDIYEVDFTNLETKLENNKLTISAPESVVGKIAVKNFEIDESNYYAIILERISKELFRATVNLRNDGSAPITVSENIEDMLLEIIPEGISNIKNMFPLEGGGPLDLLIDLATNETISIIAIGDNNIRNTLDIQIDQRIGTYTFSSIFKTGVE